MRKITILNFLIVLILGCSACTLGPEELKVHPANHWRSKSGDDPLGAQRADAICQHEAQEAAIQPTGLWEPWPTRERIEKCMNQRGYIMVPTPRTEY